MRTTLFLLALVVGFFANSVYAQDNVVQHLQDISVTIKAGGSQGSGFLFTRKEGNDTVTFVHTCGHVIDSLRKTREIIDPASGTKRTAIEFSDAILVQQYTQNGRRIGELNLDAKVVKYSNSETGEDLALLEVRKRNFVPENISVKFYLEEAIPPVGTELYHVGSLLGVSGTNSLTSGLISQVGRVLNINNNGIVFDQSEVPGFPGSSGGVMALKSDGRCVGILVRGSGETLNFFVPVRRIKQFYQTNNMLWALDQNVPMPTQVEVDKIPVEDSGVTFLDAKANTDAERLFPKLIIENKDNSEPHNSEI